MPDTYKLIQSITVPSGGQTSMDFTSIPQTYTDLLLKVSARTTRNEPNDYLRINFNGTTSGYTDKNLQTQGGGGSVTSETNNGGGVYGFSYGLNGNTSPASAFGNIEIYIPNYTLGFQKAYATDCVVGTAASTSQVCVTALSWNNTNAITSIVLRSHDPALTLMQHSSAQLYGIIKS